MLLEHKKTGQPGIYQKFADGEEYEKDLDALLERLKEMNAGYKALGLDPEAADDFITKRIHQTKKYLYHLAEVMASGYVDRGSLLFASRELLASIGESHSAFQRGQHLHEPGDQHCARRPLRFPRTPFLFPRGADPGLLC
jgi:aspartate kinase